MTLRLAIAILAMSVLETSVTAQQSSANAANYFSVISQLTLLVATQGVYALAVIFIFFAWRRATSDFVTASQTNKKHLSAVHTVVVLFTLFLALVATVVWIYATFVYRPVTIARGQIAGLTQVVNNPLVPGGKAVYQDVSVEKVPGIDSYSFHDAKGSSPDYDFRWILVSRDTFDTAAFLLRHTYESVIVDSAPGIVPVPNNTKPRTLTVTKFDERRFVLDLSKMAPGSELGVVYEVNQSAPEKAGQLFLQTEHSGRQPIQWALFAPSVAKAQRHVSWYNWFLPAAFAQAGQTATPFRSDGSYDSRTAQVLRQRLGSGDLQSQVATRRLLVQSGSTAFRFIEDSIDIRGEERLDSALLLHNLAAVVMADEAAGLKFSRAVYLKMAMALYAVGDYGTAAQFFDRAGGPVESASDYLKRGYSYEQATQIDKAVADYNAAIQQADSSYTKAAAHNALGTLYLNHGQPGKADSELSVALSTDPSVAAAMNNRAFGYAQSGTKLDEAYVLVNKALATQPRNADFLDTKGWILFKQNKLSDAVATLEQAVKIAPNNKNIQSHLTDAKSALGRKPVARQYPVRLEFQILSLSPGLAQRCVAPDI
jgi:tetratricopeptide (TPR) repeat protein